MSKSPQQREARIISDALHYVRRYSGKRVVIKYGGNAMVDKALQTSFARDVILLKLVGISPIIVHGGGPHINSMLSKIGKQSFFVDGLRYTDNDTMDVVEMVLGGLVNQGIVNQINAAGGRAVGLTGKDGGVIAAKRLRLRSGDGDKDIGLVGQVQNINPELLTVLENANFIPIIAPIGSSSGGETLNINADSAAAEIAIALQAQALFLMTNVSGILDKKQNLIPQLSLPQARRMLKGSVIKGGMKPKLECAINAVSGGVASAQIINGTVQHSLLLEIFTNQGAGTFISK